MAAAAGDASPVGDPGAVAVPTRLVLVRHGEAQSHVDQVVGGLKGCTGLSGLGRRQTEALRDRLATSGELAGHGGVIEHSFLALGQLSLSREFLLRIENTSITEWEGPPAGSDERRWTLVRFNDAAHLAGVA